MIILDTNVISEAMRPLPSIEVMSWLDTMSPSELATTTITVAEIKYGLARLPFGRRRQNLEVRFAAVLSSLFGNRIFSFDTLAAECYGELAAARAEIGRPMQRFDGLIAAIAASRGLGLATRNVRDFEACGIAVVDPWNAAPV